jgi:hypothetical protein
MIFHTHLYSAKYSKLFSSDVIKILNKKCVLQKDQVSFVENI